MTVFRRVPFNPSHLHKVEWNLFETPSPEERRWLWNATHSHGCD